MPVQIQQVWMLGKLAIHGQKKMGVPQAVKESCKIMSLYNIHLFISVELRS